MKLRLRRKYRNLISEEIFGGPINEENINSICLKIIKYRKYIQRLKAYHQLHEGDYRDGHETYGYTSLESIVDSLEYISDRFGCAFRLAWLVDVPAEVYKLKEAK